MKLERPAFDLARPVTTSLSPARVVDIEPGRVQLEIGGHRHWAVSALAHYYRPVVDDIVLAISETDAYYVIGVIKGSGTLTLNALGDVEIKALKGDIKFFAKRAVRIKAEDVSLNVRQMHVVAENLIERLGNAARSVMDTFTLRSKRIRTTVDEDYRLKADRIIERADGDVKIDGNQIHLG